MSIKNKFFKEINNNKIIFFGDDHDMNQGRNWLAKVINDITNIDFFAIEYVETSKQKLIDDDNDENLIKYLKKVYKEFPGFSPESIINIINICKRKKIKVIAIEMPEESFKDWKTEKSQQARIKYITKQIYKLAKNKKGVVLMGADHVEKVGNNVLNNVKKIIKQKIVSVIFIGGKNWTIDTEDYWIRRLEIKFITENNNLKMKYLKVINEKYPTDWIIHFPQSEILHK